MASATVTSANWSSARRRAVMQHIGATLVPGAISHALAAPLIGLTLIWGSPFVAMLCQVASSGGAGLAPALSLTWAAIVAAYAAAALPAALAGVWAALLSPFAPQDARFYAGAAAIGMVSGFLFISAPEGAGEMFGGQLFLGVVGAVSGFLCAWGFRNGVLKRDEAERDNRARDRAERLARERASGLAADRR